MFSAHHIPARLRLITGLAAALGCALLVAGCGGASAIKLTSAATCSSYLAAVPNVRDESHVDFDGQLMSPAVASVASSICNSRVRGLGVNPLLKTQISEIGPTCTQWLAMGLPQQTALTRATVGSVNLVLRVRGVTSICAAESPADQSADSIADEIVSTAASYPHQLNIDLAKLPNTINPTDPDRCNERTAAVSGADTNAEISSGLGDCVVMGF